jgi:signal transduction histidine kinase/CheY-like chemotaxis protein
MTSLPTPTVAGKPTVAPSEQTKALLLVAIVMVLVGLVGWAFALALPAGAFSDERFRVIGASALAAVVAGMLAGGWAWRCWHRDGNADRATVRKLNGFHAVMSQTNRLILRRPDPHELFEGVCEVCVNAGHVDLAVIDLSNVGEVQRAVASRARADSVPSTAQLLLAGAHFQVLMMNLALRSDLPIVIDDASTDERLSEARSWCVATGHYALGAIALKRGDVPAGILLLHSKTRGFFDGAVIPLLAELGADLSFALDNADRERDRHAASLAEHARSTAEDANRAKTAFLAQMSHELRTPLNAMLGFAQLLATDRVQVLSPGQAERVRLITHAGWHLLGLVNDVMDISRIESGRFEVVNVRGDISAVLDEAVALTQPLARTHRVELSERAASKAGIGAMVDPRRLLQVLLNLLSNACKYNRPGGRIRVDVMREGGDVFIDVVDNGVGMTREQLAHLFEPFNRLGNKGHAIEGSGIGLALTRQLVEMMHGRLEVESTPASGTRARVVLPACAIPLEAPANPVSTPGSAQEPQSTAVVLYIEDDPVNHILVEQMLSRCDGVHLLQAENATDGITLAQQTTPDLVLLDMHLPDMSGLDVLAALRADPRTQALRVVAVSANAMPTDVAAAMEMGVLEYWTKPLRLEAFLAGISKLLRVRIADAVEATGGGGADTH